MNKTIKKAIVTILLLCVAFAFACFTACGETTTETPTNPSQQEQAENEQSPEHTCSFVVEKAEEKYLKSAATCTAKAVYYKSCSCGKASETETFEYGTLANHIYENNVCTVCCKNRQSEGLEFELNESETEYSVTGIGTCTDTDLVIPKTYNNLPVTSIGERAFCGCSSLISVTIPDSVTNIRSGAFAACYSLTNITIPDSVTSIERDTFFSCVSLISITIPDSVTSIGLDAFSGCCSLMSVTIPNSITCIEGWAFYGCIKLVEVINKSRSDIFYGNDTRTNSYIGEYALVIHNGNSKIETIDNYQFITKEDDLNYLVNYIGNEDVLTLPEKYKGNNYEINKYAFYNCSSPVSIEIPTSVTSIGEYAFGECSSLVSIDIPTSVTGIGEYAFKNCSSLQYYEDDNACYLGNETKNYLWLIKVKSTDITSCTINENCSFIYGSAFHYCRSLTSVTIGNNVINIGKSAFSWCDSLVSVTIGNNVTRIEGEAFAVCSSLTSVYYKGTAEQWANISIGSTNSDLTNAMRYYYSETEPTGNGNYWHYDENGNITVW